MHSWIGLEQWPGWAKSVAADVTFGSKWAGWETMSAAADTKSKEKGKWDSGQMRFVAANMNFREGVNAVEGLSSAATDLRSAR